jgi:hypothetical protein
MTIFTKSLQIKPFTLLRENGYEYRKDTNDFIRDTNGGRWHAKIHHNRIEFHYDLIVNGKHEVFDLPILCSEERKSILNSVYNNKYGLRVAL